MARFQIPGHGSFLTGTGKRLSSDRFGNIETVDESEIAELRAAEKAGVGIREISEDEIKERLRQALEDAGISQEPVALTGDEIISDGAEIGDDPELVTETSENDGIEGDVPVSENAQQIPASLAQENAKDATAAVAKASKNAPIWVTK